MHGTGTTLLKAFSGTDNPARDCMLDESQWPSYCIVVRHTRKHKCHDVCCSLRKHTAFSKFVAVRLFPISSLSSCSYSLYSCVQTDENKLHRLNRVDEPCIKCINRSSRNSETTPWPSLWRSLWWEIRRIESPSHFYNVAPNLGISVYRAAVYYRRRGAALVHRTFADDSGVWIAEDKVAR